jgi:ATP-dependent DNA helicase DinG
MREGFHLTVEAGTGVGKSFAYLAGAIDQALAKNGKVLISTHTINLQQQLIEKDIPFLTDIIPDGFSARLAKGRSHYLCSRRLDYAIKRKATLFDEDARALGRIAEWAEGTTSGSLSELEVVPPRETWQEVQSEHGNCESTPKTGNRRHHHRQPCPAVQRSGSQGSWSRSAARVSPGRH